MLMSIQVVLYPLYLVTLLKYKETGGSMDKIPFVNLLLKLQQF